MIRSIAEIEADYCRFYPATPVVHDYTCLHTPPPRNPLPRPISPSQSPAHDKHPLNLAPSQDQTDALASGGEANIKVSAQPNTISCHMCGAQEGTIQGTIHCGLCQREWHIDCMTPKYLSEQYDPRWDDDGRWCCPECTEPSGGRWDQAM